jgi:hypothetical protein
MNDQQLYDMCFIGLEKNQYGFGTKRITIKFPGTICDIITVSGFGYKTQDQTKHIGIRLWIDQGDHTMRTPYIKGKSILQHFNELIKSYENKLRPRGAIG